MPIFSWACWFPGGKTCWYIQNLKFNGFIRTVCQKFNIYPWDVSRYFAGVRYKYLVVVGSVVSFVALRFNFACIRYSTIVCGSVVVCGTPI